MKAENLISKPLKMSYKFGVYGSMGFVSLALTAFIVWSFTCMGGAVFTLMS
jgi:hypothetical protein